ncbi:MAG TPA: hypothetical protein VJ984_00020 [Xanthomonadales bacterium]|nr:hypothetical protein [Xanthomonadales bacterium]
MLKVASIASLLLLALPLTSFAQDDQQPEFTPPCEGAVWWTETDATRSDFDFWVGEWMVYEKESGLMVGFDMIEEIRGGCAIRQHWRHMNDLYSIPGASWRMQGGGDSSLGVDGKWHQTWIDNNGSHIQLSGGLDDDGVMVLQSDWMEFTDRQGNKRKNRHRWHWAPQDDGTIHNWGFQQTELPQASDWVKYYDVIYRPNVVGGPTSNLNP